jgi:hypothetical protein
MRQRNVFSLLLKILSVSALVMSDGKLFHILAAATETHENKFFRLQGAVAPKYATVICKLKVEHS